MYAEHAVFQKRWGAYTDHVTFFTAAQRAFMLFVMDKGNVAVENGVLYVLMTNYNMSGGFECAREK